MRTGSNGRRQFNSVITATVGVLSLVLSASILRAQSVDMQYVTVGDPGNAPNTSGLGEVDYTYDIGEYDVTNSQYVTFLNSVDPTGGNALGLYSGGYKPLNGGVGGVDSEYGILFNANAPSGLKYSVGAGFDQMPVEDVNFWDAIRFANWLDDGNTETGAYTLLGGTPTPSNALTLGRNAGATVWLPSESEWYKAGFYDPNYGGPGVGGYWAYATQSNAEPGNIIGSGSNEANYEANGLYAVTQSNAYSSTVNYLTPVGAFTNSTSYYGTYDQAGEELNWSDTGNGYFQELMGNNWAAGGPNGGGANPASEYDNYFGSIGFRVASIAAVPEPSSMAIASFGVLMLGRIGRRKLMKK